MWWNWLTWRPSAILINVERITSAERKASGKVIRRMAESSKVRSNHWFAWVLAAFCVQTTNEKKQQWANTYHVHMNGSQEIKWWKARINETILYLWQGHEIARETADSLGAHRIALVGHRTWPDLVLAKWLLCWQQKVNNIVKTMNQGSRQRRQWFYRSLS